MISEIYTIGIRGEIKMERRKTMDLLQVKTHVDVKDEKTKLFFSRLDEAIDDYENGRVIEEEEMWAELEHL